MKKLLFISLFFLISSCEKLEWNLPRDNPLDYNAESTDDKKPDLVFSKYEVVYDNNNDGIVNKGETVYLKIFIENNGATANNVKVEFSSSSSYINSLSPNSQNYGDIPANTEIAPRDINYYSVDGYDYYSTYFNINMDTPNEETISFELKMTDENGNSWTDNFEITIKEINATLNYNRYEVVYEDNNNGVINKGETAYIKIFIKNNGTSDVIDVYSDFSTNSEYVTSLTPSTRYYGDIPANTEIAPQDINYYSANGYDYYTISFFVKNETPIGHEIKFDIEINDEIENYWSDSFNIKIE